MRKIWEKSFSLVVALMMVLTMIVPAFASESRSASREGLKGSFEVTEYAVNSSYITKGSKVNITLTVKYNATDGSELNINDLDLDRLVDSFSGGTIQKATQSDSGTFKFQVEIQGLTYKGSGNTLRLMVKKGSGYQNLETTISECKEYTEPTVDPTPTPTPDPLPEPRVVFSRNELGADIKAGESRAIAVTVKNAGTVTIQDPVVSFTASDSLILTGSSSQAQLKNLAAGASETVVVTVKAVDPVASASQYIDAEIKFNYYNRVSTTAGSSTGRISVPAYVKKAKEEKKEEEQTASPLPNIIVSHFDYGGASVAAGNKFNLSFRFKNTSRSISAENMVVTVDAGEGLMMNGSSNTFFFNKIKPGKSKTVSLPMKTLKTVTDSSPVVSINFKYEYLDHKKRTSATTDIKLSVPVYQPDRFEITKPVVPESVTAGEEVTLTLNYVNKSKTEIANLTADVEGNVETATATQNIGNLEAGKSGTIAMVVTPMEEGEQEVTIKVSYEDGNGDSKERIFPVVLNVQAAEPYDPGMDDPGTDDPGEEDQGGFKWWMGAIAAAVAAVIALIVIKKRKKAKAAKKEQELWDSWDKELGSMDTNAQANTAETTQQTVKTDTEGK